MKISAGHCPTCTCAHVSGAPSLPTVWNLIEATALECNVSVGDVVGRGRSRHVAIARHVAIFLARFVSSQSYPTLGAVFQRDHTSTLHAARRVAAAVCGDKAYGGDPAEKARIAEYVRLVCVRVAIRPPTPEWARTLLRKSVEEIGAT